MADIVFTTQQLHELTAYYHDYTDVSDINQAICIYNHFLKVYSTTEASEIWNRNCALGAILRVGFILGQRAERSRRAERRSEGGQHHE